MIYLLKLVAEKSATTFGDLLDCSSSGFLHDLEINDYSTCLTFTWNLFKLQDIIHTFQFNLARNDMTRKKSAQLNHWWQLAYVPVNALGTGSS